MMDGTELILELKPLEEEVKLLSRVRLCDPVDCSPSGSSVHGILQARILEWVAISFSRHWRKWQLSQEISVVLQEWE